MKGEHFMDTTNTVESNTKNTQPKKYEFAEAFGNILFFPFRLAFYAYKYTIRVVSIILFISIIAASIRAAFPMNLPETHGVTYYQFLHERIDAYNKFQDESRNTGIHKFVGTSLRFVLYPFAVMGVYPLVIAYLYPDSWFGKWVYQKMDKNRTIPMIFPQGEAKLSNFFALTWETVERTSWEWYVVLGSHPTIFSSDYIPYPNYSTDN